MKNWLFPLWVIVDILLTLSCLALWITAPEFKTLNICLTVFAVSLGVLLLFVKQQEIKIYVKSTYFKHVGYHLCNVLLVAVIFGLLNYLGNKNAKEYDLTGEKRNSLTEQSTKIVSMVKTPLKLTVFAKREEWNPILNLLKLYRTQNKFIQIEAIDSDLRPDLIQSKGIKENGTVVLEYQKKESKFLAVDELAVTNALLKMLRDEKIVLYMIKGHEEISCEDSSPEGLSALCERLKSQNYEVKDLDLTQISEMPKDATALLIAGPTTSFLPQEINLLKSFSEKGGSIFLALAPAFKSSLYDDLVKLAHPYGLTMGKDVVVDRLSTVQGAEATIPIVNKYESQHVITSQFNLRTVFPLSSSVSVLPGNDTAEILARTSSFPGSWAETDLKGLTTGKAAFEEKSDIKGPIGLMGVGERLQTNSRLVLLGSSSFLVNAYQGMTGNTTLFLNATSWMVNDEGIISFNRPGVEEVPVVMSAQHLQMIFVISILLVPILFFGSAIFVYRRRRLL